VRNGEAIQFVMGAQYLGWENFRQATDCWPGVARRLVTFLVSPRKVTKRRRPQQSRIPEDQARRVGGKELAPPCCFDFVFCGRGSNTFAADPPDALDLRRVCKGKNVKTSLAMSCRRELDRRLRCEAIESSLKYTSHPVITGLVLTCHPSQSRRKLSLPGGSAAKVFEPRSPPNIYNSGASSLPPVRQARFPGFRG